MRTHRHLFAFALVAFFAITLQAAQATPPVLLSAVSRMTHGNAGIYDVQLPLTGGSGIECRSVAAGMTLVMTFDQPVASGTAAITTGTATVSGSATFSNYTMSVKLTAVTDAQVLALTLSNVKNAAGDTLASATVPFRTLFGDVNGDGVLNGSDSLLVKSAVANVLLSYATFRCDISVDGALTGTDYLRERAAVNTGASVAGGATNNTPPTISQVATQSVVSGTAMSPIGFMLADNETDPSLLAVVAYSSDQITIPNNMITVSGTGASRTVSVMPSAGVTAVTPVTITMYASDGLAYSTAMSFTVNVTPPPTVYLAILSPVAGTSSLGSGTAVLTLSGDQTYANIKWGYSNMSGTLTDDAVFSSAGTLSYDMPVGRVRGDLQSDGSLKWTFGANQATYVAGILSNSDYLLVDTSAFSAGELQGTFKLISGSQTFTAPTTEPATITNATSAADASRFFQQAAFGGTGTQIATLANQAASNAPTALTDWLTAQYAQPMPIYPDYSYSSVAPPYPLTAQTTVTPYTQPYSPSSMYAQIYSRVTTAQAPNAYGDTLSDDRIHESWWKNVVTAPDSLRQRVATALSEIFVVSEIDGTIDGNIPGLASYYDMLADDAFANFRQILGDVTLHPVMGHYLTMLGNSKTAPNENYAREVMQLFSIGLYMLNPDGTLVLDSTGSPIPTYTQPLVTSFAAVYTGWNVNSSYVVVPQLLAPVSPATQPSVTNFNSYYQKPMVVTASNHSTVAKTLLSYAGAPTYPGASQPAFIPATTSQTATTATAELNFALDNIFYHPNVGPFICKQLIQRLVESNPSPGYIYRVTSVFNNDGTGVRGNMKAVITAILTDYEARSPAVQTDAGYGHMREPMIRMADIMHSLNSVSKSTK